MTDDKVASTFSIPGINLKLCIEYFRYSNIRFLPFYYYIPNDTFGLAKLHSQYKDVNKVIRTKGKFVTRLYKH